MRKHFEGPTSANSEGNHMYIVSPTTARQKHRTLSLSSLRTLFNHVRDDSVYLYNNYWMGNQLVSSHRLSVRHCSKSGLMRTSRRQRCDSAQTMCRCWFLSQAVSPRHTGFTSPAVLLLFPSVYQRLTCPPPPSLPLLSAASLWVWVSMATVRRTTACTS